MRNGTNLFFLAIGAYTIWWGVREYQKQKQAQDELFTAQETGIIPPIDYEAAQATRFRTGFEYPLSYERTGYL